MQKEWFIDFI